MNTDIVYRYIGNGAFVVADIPIPARNIQEWEVMQSPELKAAIELNIANAPGTCFERVEPAPVVKKATKQPVNVEATTVADKAE